MPTESLPFPYAARCDCICENRERCECEPLGILIEIEGMESLSIPFEEGVTVYGDNVELTTSYAESYEDISYYSCKEDRNVVHLLTYGGAYFGGCYSSAVNKYMNWVTARTAEKIRITYRFEIDPDKCKVVIGGVTIRSSVNLYTKTPSDYALCGPVPRITGRIRVIVFDEHSIRYAVPCGNITGGICCLEDGPFYTDTCDLGLELTELDEYIPPDTCEQSIAEINEKHIEYPIPDEPEYLYSSIENGYVSILDIGDSPYCEDTLHESVLSGITEYPAEWGEAWKYDQCDPSNDLIFCSRSGTCVKMWTASPPIRNGTAVKVTLYYA